MPWYLTLLVVVVVRAVGVGAFLAYRSYDDAKDQARTAEARAESAETRAVARERAAEGQYQDGYLEGVKKAVEIAGLNQPGWYVVSVERGETPGVQPGDVVPVSEMAACKSYWWDPSVWSRQDENC